MSLAPKFKWNVNEPTLDRLTKAYINRNLDNILEIVADVADKTAYDMKVMYILQGSRTGSVWHDMINEYRGNSRGARVDSGRMLNSVGSTASIDVGSGVIEGQYGLRMPGAGGMKYFLEQEYGFDLTLNNGNVRAVPGMHTYDRTVKMMKSKLRKGMLSKGFLSGTVDTRGAKILGQMKFGTSFAEAWSNVFGKEMTVERRDAFNRLADRRYEYYMQKEMAIRARIEIARANMIRAGYNPEQYINRFKG